MKKIPLHWQILIALVLAIIFGLIFKTNYKLDSMTSESFKTEVESDVLDGLKSIENQSYPTQQAYRQAIVGITGEQTFKKNQSLFIKAAYHNPAVEAIHWIGEIFLKALRMIIIPLVMSSLISGVVSIGSGTNLGRLGFKTMFYYITTSLLAIITGLFFVNLIRPGVGADLNFSEVVDGLEVSQSSFKSILLDIVPSNIFKALTDSNMLAIIFFSLLFGYFITKVAEKYRKALEKAFNAIFEVIMKMTEFIILFTPLGVFALVAKVVADQDDLISLASRLGLYMLVVLLGLFIHFFISLPLIVRYLGKANPYKHLKNMATPLLTAFSTSSSAAAMPLTMDAVENKSGVSQKITNFTIPLGTTVNMDGTALYECVAVIFIAQAYGIDLSIGQQMIVILTSLLASIGAAAVPMAGLVMMTIILSAVGLPMEGIGLILAVDRILDMFRTSTNVWSDTCGAVVIAKSEGEKLQI